MKISMECDVNGRIQIGKEIKVLLGSKEYILIPDKMGWLKTITIIKSVKRPYKYSRKIEPGTATDNATIRINSRLLKNVCKKADLAVRL
jgi:hypothetical protein